MSNMIYACWRESRDALDRAALERVADWITPELIRGRPHRMLVGRHDLLCLTGPHGAAGAEGVSAYLGAFTGTWKDWHLPGTPVPEGTFALIRSHQDLTELCSDAVGTRTIWYALTERLLLASTSQRALVCLLRGLSLSRSAFAWFLSSGTLGPTDSWDTRIRRLPRGARLTLDRARWTTRLTQTPIVFKPREIDETSARRGLQEVMNAALQGYDFRSANWILPLSGGYDSRYLIAILHESGLRPRTVTWGLAASRTQRGNDAFIAPQLARHYGLPHDYLLTEISAAPPEEVVDTFLASHGGTTDALFPYLDGLRIWARFTAEGVDGIIRGDEGFGTRPRPEIHHRFAQGLILLEDFLDADTAGRLSEGQQVLPEEVQRQPGESVAIYGDRLVHAYFIPTHLAALNDVKAPFLEIANPMLSASVLDYIREMPDRMRHKRGLYESLVETINPSIPFATLAADDSRSGFLDTPPFVRWMTAELEDTFADRMLPAHFRSALLASIRHGQPSVMMSRSMRTLLKRLLPKDWITEIQLRGKPAAPGMRTLAFRFALASRLTRMLERDAALLAEQGG